MAQEAVGVSGYYETGVGTQGGGKKVKECGSVTKKSPWVLSHGGMQCPAHRGGIHLAGSPVVKTVASRLVGLG